jgi:hypothetical protein
VIFIRDGRAVDDLAPELAGSSLVTPSA